MTAELCQASRATKAEVEVRREALLDMRPSTSTSWPFRPTS